MGVLQRIISAGFFSFTTGGGSNIESVVPNCGYVTGNFPITITGSGFGSTIGTVMVGNNYAQILSWTPGNIIIIIPPVSSVAQLDIIIRSPDITGVYIAYNAFTYLLVPSSSSIQLNKLQRYVQPSPITATYAPEITRAIKQISFDIENPIRRMWIKKQNSTRLVSLGKIQTINEFVRVMWQALQIHRPTLVFEHAYPSYILDIEDAQVKLGGGPAPSMPEEVITWNVVRRTPGSIDHTPFAKAREIRPRIREELVYEPWYALDKVEPGMSTGPGQLGPDKELSRVVGREIEGQWFDNLIQFDIWSKDNKKAEELCDYLESFMHDFHGMFIELGVNKMHFHSRLRDDFLLQWRNGLCNRSILFYLRTETVRAGTIREIRKIHVNAEVKTFLNVIGSSGADAFVETSRNMIIDKWVESQVR